MPFHMSPDRSWKVSLRHHKPASSISLAHLKRNSVPFLFLECLESSLTPNGLCHWPYCPGCILNTRNRGVVSCLSLDPQPIPFSEWPWMFTQILYQLSQFHHAIPVSRAETGSEPEQSEWQCPRYLYLMTKHGPSLEVRKQRPGRLVFSRSYSLCEVGTLHSHDVSET